jgi:hypothetical protein
MTRSKLFRFIFVSMMLLSCNKSQNNNQIDVSQQDKADDVGNAIAWLNDGQWQTKVFTTLEQSLFRVLDTANVAGTTIPDSISVTSNAFFPNPFGSVASFMVLFSSGFVGQVELKYVVVDSHMKTKDFGALRIQALPDPNHPANQSSSGLIHLNPNVAPGQYRIYYTLSTEAKANFYTSWGNIERTQ